MTPQEIFEVLKKNCDFSYPLTGDNFEKKICEPLSANDAFDIEWTYETGATKLCLIFESLPFVIKIPFHGEIDDFGDYRDFSVEYLWTEVNIYDDAKEAGVESFFVENRWIGRIETTDIFIQARAFLLFDDLQSIPSAQTNFKDCSKTVKKVLNKSKFSDVINNIDTCWLYDAITFFGEEDFNRFVNFVISEGIEDLHSGNVGYIDKVPCVIDYAGYNG